jgi:hypothetical protein
MTVSIVDFPLSPEPNGQNTALAVVDPVGHQAPRLAI